MRFVGVVLGMALLIVAAIAIALIPLGVMLLFALMMGAA